MTASLLLVLQSDDPRRLRSGLALAAAAAARDETVTILWEGPALQALCAGELARSAGDWPAGVDQPSELHDALCSLSTVQQVACPTSVREARLEVEVVERFVDGIRGLPTILGECAGARIVYV
ncbi:MAG: hypothetical protein P1V51_18825 [Deltaproteobacteria bacterium]|nr:hypothetical protein [Deltaproteobacteria bacterium]